jgi:hypothetical protein
MKICEDLEVVAVYPIKIINQVIFFQDKNILLGHGESNEIAKNDGLSIFDFIDWFGEADFEGQIICWKDPKY